MQVRSEKDVLAECIHLYDADETESAREAYERALLLFPASEQIVTSYAQFLRAEFEIEQALRVLFKFIVCHERPRAAIRLSARILDALHRHDELQKLFSIAPIEGTSEATRLRARMDATAKLWGITACQWEADYKKWSGEADNFAGTIKRVRDYEINKRFDLAQYGALDLLRRYPGHNTVLLQCFSAFKRAGGEYAMVAPFFAAQSCAVNPGDIESQFRLATSLLWPGHTRRSEALFLSIVEHAPNPFAAQATAILIGIREFSGRRSDAAALLDAAVHSTAEIYSNEFKDFLRIRKLNSDILAGTQLVSAEKNAWLEKAKSAYPLLPKIIQVTKSVAGQLQTPFLPKGKPKVAICLSGQLRGYRTAWPILRDALVEPTGADVFLSTWDTVGVGAGGPDMIDRFLPLSFRNALPESLRQAQTFRASFPAVFQLLTTDDAVTTAKLKDEMNLVDCETESPIEFDQILSHMSIPAGAKNACRMTYKIWRCDQLMRQHAKIAGMRYEVVVRLRPDMRFRSVNVPAVIDSAINRLTVTTRLFKASGVEDQFAVGSSEAMELYAKIWPFIRERGSSDYLPWSRGAWSESLLRNHLMAFGLSFRAEPGFHWDLCQRVPEPLILIETALEDVHKMSAGREGALNAIISYYEEIQKSEQLTASLLSPLGQKVKDAFERYSAEPGS